MTRFAQRILALCIALFLLLFSPNALPLAAEGYRRGVLSHHIKRVQSMIVVSNTGPVNYLVLIGEIGLLRQLVWPGVAAGARRGYSRSA